MVATITIPMQFKTNTKGSNGKFVNIVINITDVSIAAIELKSEQLLPELEAIGVGSWRKSLPFTYTLT